MILYFGGNYWPSTDSLTVAPVTACSSPEVSSSRPPTPKPRGCWISTFWWLTSASQLRGLNLWTKTTLELVEANRNAERPNKYQRSIKPAVTRWTVTLAYFLLRKVIRFYCGAWQVRHIGHFSGVKLFRLLLPEPSNLKTRWPALWWCFTSSIFWTVFPSLSRAAAWKGTSRWVQRDWNTP